MGINSKHIKKDGIENGLFKNNRSISYPLCSIVIFRLYKAYKFFIHFKAMNQEFEMKLLLKQNSEMVSKIQSYRRENQLLNQRNQDLNLWVQNLSEVFAALGAAWKTITNNEQALFNLMKKTGVSNSKSVISKYISHFKTFDEIINRLGEKITNSGHSDEVTLDAKMRVNAFVQNYEMFFKEIVETYFKFNDEYLQWVTQLKNKPQLSQNFRLIANNSIENKLKIKQFEHFMSQYRGRYKIFESENQHQLLDGILIKKNQQINSLKQLTQKQARRLQLCMTYSTASAQTVVDGNVEDCECFCGGRQVAYFKKEWEEHLQEMRKSSSAAKQIKGETENTLIANREDMQLMEFEKQKLFDRISTLNMKIEKMKTQTRLSEELVLGSSAYSILHSQAEDLVVFVDELLTKISQHYTFLYEIQKAREEEIIQLKNKLQKQQSNINSSSKTTNEQSPKIKVETNLVEFKTNVTQWIKELHKQYVEMNSKIELKQDGLTKSKEFIASLQKEITELNKKIQQLQTPKPLTLQFRHEKFNQVEKKISALVSNMTQTQQRQSLSTLWREFIGYVKSRDKKVRDLQTVIKKREKEVAAKDKLVNVLQQGLKETEGVFLAAQTQVKKFSQFITNTEKQLHQLAEKNLALRSQFQQQKVLLNYKQRTEAESRLKMEEKIRVYESLQQQVKEVRRISHEAEMNYENWIMEQERKLMSLEVKVEQAEGRLELKKAECEQKDKAIKKLNQEKEKWKSQCNKLGARFNAIEEKSQLGVLKMQMEEYKRKLMCNCSRDQERTVVLKTCPHAFCRKCIEDMNNSRNRKCPMCGVKFGKSDLHDIILS